VAQNQERFNRAELSAMLRLIVPNLNFYLLSICGLSKSLGPARFAAYGILRKLVSITLSIVIFQCCAMKSVKKNIIKKLSHF